MKLIFYIKGGAGKVLAATPAVLKKYEYENQLHNGKLECVVVSGYPELWDNLGVTTLHSNQLEKFYSTYVKDQECMIYAHDPYDEGDYIAERINLVEAFFRVYGIGDLYEKDLPIIRLTDEELADVDATLEPFTDKPPIAIQISGGPENQNTSFSWTRDLHVSQAEVIAKVLSERFHVFQIRRDDQPPIPGINTFSGNRREIMAFLSRCRGGLFIDSFAQHAAAGLGVGGVVLFIGTSEKQTGYHNHLNLSTKVRRNKDYPKHALFFPYNLWGDPFECPYDSPELFDLQEVINSIVYKINENEDSSN